MDTPDLQAAKAEFADRFVHAVLSRSVDQCADLVLPFSEYQLLTNDTKTSEKKYRKALHKQCSIFLQKYQSFFDKHGDRLASGNVEQVYIHRLRDRQELSNGSSVADCSFLEISMQSRTLGNGDLATAHFKVEGALLINGEFRVHNFLLVEARESIDSITKNVSPLKEMGFSVLRKADYAQVLQGHPASFARPLSGNNEIMFYDGDLTLTPAQHELLKHHGLLVSGNLTVDGVLHCEDLGMLVVLGDLTASSVILEEGVCLVSGTARFTDALIVFDEAPTQIAAAEGPLVYTASESADIGIATGAVQVCIDYENGRVFGDPAALLDPAFLMTEDGETLVDLGALYHALMRGQRLK